MKGKLAIILLLLVGLTTAGADVRAQDSSSSGGSSSAKSGNGQQPTPPAEGEVGPYTVTSTFELGVRGVSVNGDADKYRSDFNYEPGFHLFSSSLIMRSKDSDGKLFDTLMVNSFGWDSDPNRYIRVSVDKTKWYKFDGNYRQVDYFNSLRTFARNQHIANTQFKIGDFDLTILPQNERIRFNVGYSLERTSGPTVATYDYSRDEFPILAPTRVTANTFHFGADARVWVFDLSFQQGFRYYKEDTTYDIDLPSPGPPPNNPGNNGPPNLTFITGFHREFPTRGRTPWTRFSAHTTIGRRLDFTGRYIYSSATSEYALFETVTGQDFSGNNITGDLTTAFGTAKRPNGMGDLAATLFVTDKFRISDTFRINNFRINGAEAFSEALFRTRTTPFGETPLAPIFTDNLDFTVTKYRRAINTIEGDYEFTPRFAIHVGHRYTDRRIERGDLVQPPVAELETEPFDNRTNSFFAGFKARPLPFWTVYFDIEKGENDNIFTRVDNYDYTNFRVRTLIKPTRNLNFNLSFVTKDNTNPALTEETPRRDFGATVNTRLFSLSADWTPNEKFSISSGYTYNHVTSEAVIVFFVANVQRDGLSRYFLKDHFAYVNFFAQVHPRVRFSAGYRYNKDNGQGDRIGPDLVTPVIPDIPVLIFSNPLQFQSPEFRVAVKLHDRIDWNVGYQWYDYKESIPNYVDPLTRENLQKYNAHLPYTSLTFYIGRAR
jgi:hypothetical protein